MAETYDIVIVGAGPVGLMFAACLSRLGPYKIKHIDNRAEPTATGRASGIQARTLDVLQNMGLKRSIMAYDPGRVYEVAFWNASDQNGIQRTGNSKSYPDYIDTRYPFSTIIHQGRIEKIFLDDLKNRGVEVQRPWTISGFREDNRDSTYPLEVDLVSVDGSKRSTLRTKYIFGADGPRSVMRQILDIPMLSKDPTVHVWSVIDGVVKSDFPDIQIKCTIHSPAGSAMIIPHGNNRVRIYLQIFPKPGEQPLEFATLPRIQQVANVILSPYKVEWESVEWHSAYRIGQAIASRYTLDQRVFIGGDACHTHSPKAGQGMNYGFLDAHNLAWKLHLVESGFMKRSLLGTYEEERKLAAARLIEFDAKYANLFSSRQSSNIGGQNSEFIQVFKENSLLTSGYGVSYPPSPLIWASSHTPGSLRTGHSFPTVTVTRVVDAHVAYLEQEIPFNGSYRIYIFAGNSATTSQAILHLTDHLHAEESVFRRYQRNDVDLSYEKRHNPHSDFFTFSVIFSAQRSSVEIHECLPDFLACYKYHIYADDHRGRDTTQNGERGAAHIKMGFDVEKGGVVVVRPDGYVALIVDLVDGRKTAEALNGYFAPIVLEEKSTSALARL
ncbi:Monooxygenase, FAD-binding [Penicillium expansum]|uniref:Monooxygenase, FAD-binding n=1 Tax=Penicillium expansum TaxID=27334 RepID=A0A0A2JG66_PENEN|nr:Monooxygenase, FAD-binding [Penicillium expansum]KGO51295.1 Monooxygenase, FAD-binding [Penicillium expansum]